ncbi:MAG: glycosyltransferase, partial [Desulfovibrionaceae bacterium]
LADLFASADVLHFHMTADEDMRFGPFTPRDHLAGKIIVHHHHGHHDFRGNPPKYQHKYNERGRRNLLVSTPDLLRLLPEARWQPNRVPIHESRLLPLDGKPAAPVRLVHSPTRKDLKNTDDLLAACDALKTRGVSFELDLIDDVPNHECLDRKRRAHVLFDHMQGYYGVSSLEGLSQGLAVIAGIDGWCRTHMVEFAETENLPWVVAHGRDELEARLAELVGQPERTAELGRASRRFMQRHWSDRKVSARLADFYQHALT